MRNKFEEQLQQLNEMLIEMGKLVEKAIALAIDALEKQDTVLAEQAIAFDDEIDQKEKDIEALCLRLLMQQQPVARDLRQISAVLKMITDIERIGDHAADMSEITIILAQSQYIKIPEHIPQMASATAKMLTDSIDAFVNRDPDLAKRVIESDDIVDDLFMTVRQELISLLSTDKEYAEQAVDLQMIAKYFERIGDHAVNIAEWVIFAVEGKYEKA